ncbi:MAG: hypothetical protein K1X33_07175 [Methanobacteriaceae archaeon]|nr:hypothetical protein [Methanobacteriaceae archaeon]
MVAVVFSNHFNQPNNVVTSGVNSQSSSSSNNQVSSQSSSHSSSSSKVDNGDGSYTKTIRHADGSYETILYELNPETGKYEIVAGTWYDKNGNEIGCG